MCLGGLLHTERERRMRWQRPPPCLGSCTISCPAGHPQGTPSGSLGKRLGGKLCSRHLHLPPEFSTWANYLSLMGVGWGWGNHFVIPLFTGHRGVRPRECPTLKEFAVSLDKRDSDTVEIFYIISLQMTSSVRPR